MHIWYRIRQIHQSKEGIVAHEITPWKMPGCALAIPTIVLSDRERHSQEINNTYGESGGLNANYRHVEAAAVAANILGAAGLVYNIDFVIKTVGDAVVFDFKDQSTLLEAQRRLPRTEKIAA